MNPEMIRQMFPRLSMSEAREAAAVFADPKVRAALERMRSACDYVAGSLFCTCPVEARPSDVDLALVAPLALVAARGAETLPAGG